MRECKNPPPLSGYGSVPGPGGGAGVWSERVGPHQSIDLNEYYPNPECLGPRRPDTPLKVWVFGFAPPSPY